ncbi:MAG: DNA gyrase/topoisomerase IV subunit A [Bacteroidales bacterium]
MNDNTDKNLVDSIVNIEGEDDVKYITGMYRTWFLDYASYVILERAVPYLNDGLKPVQRRILHAMKEMDDGRFNKVANIIGQTMQYHPHGDASIGDALVQIGQKELLVEAQGNWGNVFTGDGAAAPRYIEARLSKFALEVLFNGKTTDWQMSYDGRKREPLTLPVKFPLLLAQGVEGIAVGLACKILPHNFIELIDASIAYLSNEEFEIFPDFLGGGLIDVSKYNDGLRGGNVKVRAKIEKQDTRTLVITEIPFGKTTTSVIESIVKANEKGKIKIKKIDDNTAENVEIVVNLGSGVSPDKMIDALYAFTDCEISVSPNSCVIIDDKPVFMGVKEILCRCADQTQALLTKELEIRKSELLEQWHFSSLEKIFIEERIYKDKGFEDSKNIDDAILHIDKRLEPWKPKLIRELGRDDILKLMEIKMGRILKFNSDKADELIVRLEDETKQIDQNLEHIIKYTIDYYVKIKEKYGKGKERRTEIRSFENIVAAKVAVANTKLYVDYTEGFMGFGLKRNETEFICDCSDIDEIIVFRRDGTYFVTKISEKAFIGKDIIHVAVFRKNDKRTIYNVVYRDGRSGGAYMKRFFVTSVTRDKEYDLTQGKANSKILYFSANPNGEAEVLKVLLKAKPRLKKLVFDVDLGQLSVKNRNSIGNVVSKNEVYRVTLKNKGNSTLGGRKLWFDRAVNRLNTENRGEFLGEFSGSDVIFALHKAGYYQLYSADLSMHFEPDVLYLCKYDRSTIVTLAFYDADQKNYYIKRFFPDAPINKPIIVIGENKDSCLMEYSFKTYPQFEVSFGGRDEARPELIINVDEFIAVKSDKARGKRVSTFEISGIKDISPDEPTKEPSSQEDIAENIPFEANRPHQVEMPDVEDDEPEQLTLDFGDE